MFRMARKVTGKAPKVQILFFCFVTLTWPWNLGHGQMLCDPSLRSWWSYVFKYANIMLIWWWTWEISVILYLTFTSRLQAFPVDTFFQLSERGASRIVSYMDCKQLILLAICDICILVWSLMCDLDLWCFCIIVLHPCNAVLVEPVIHFC